MLEDVLEPGLAVVFCGTAASARSAAVMQYYAGRGNKFWRILHETGLTPRRLEPAEYRLLPQFGIGLTDIVKGQSGADRDIDFTSGVAERAREALLRCTPGFVCFNGKRAAQEFFGGAPVAYGRSAARIGDAAVFVLPSTSGLASGAWDDSYWHAAAEAVRSGPP